jgi:hypothetical protein
MPIHAFLPKHLHTPRGIMLLLVVIVGVDKERCLKCDVDTLAIILRFISHHLPNGPSISLQSVSFRFGWMNYDPFDAALVGARPSPQCWTILYVPQAYCLSVSLPQTPNALEWRSHSQWSTFELLRSHLPFASPDTTLSLCRWNESSGHLVATTRRKPSPKWHKLTQFPTRYNTNWHKFF